jgi:hypothetical protein
VSGGGSLETNESLGLSLRTQIGGLAGMRFVNTNRAQFETGGGLVANEEKGLDTPTTQNLEGLLEMYWSYYTYDKPKTQFGLNMRYYPSLSSWGRQRFQMESNIRRDVWKDFHASLNVFDAFDSDPPNPDAATNDVGVEISAGWTF